MTVDQLSLYNGALTMCTERILASLSENREPRRLLDQAWTEGNGGALQACLELGQWKFATRSQLYTYSPSVEPSFGYQFAFNKPDDFVRTTAVCNDPYYNNPLTEYADEAGFWFADIDTIYIKYISNDPSYGLNFSLYPQSYTYLVQAFLAKRIIGRLTQAKEKKDSVEAEFKQYLLEAKSKDAWADPTKFFPQGSWAGSRFGRYSRNARGNGGNF